MTEFGDLPPLKILYEDNHCLVLYKEPGILSDNDDLGSPNLLEQARAYIKEKYQKPGAVYLTLIHRLDRPVSGVILLAKTSKAAARLNEQFQKRTVEKIYRAKVEGIVSKEQDSLVHWLIKDHKTNITRVAKPIEKSDAKECRLSYRVIDRYSDQSLIEINLDTGRSHQIRVQLAAIGHPICGDTKYGAKPMAAGKIALDSYSLGFDHPVTKERLIFKSP